MSARTRAAALGGCLIVLLSIAATRSVQAQDEGAPPVPQFVGSHRDWNVYKFRDDAETICYMASEPKKQEGNYTRRGNPAVLVTRRPGARVLYEVSVQPGYSYLDGSEVEIQIDQRKFQLFTRGEHAWARREEDDRNLISAMRRGVNMTVRGTSTRSTYSLDTYSLLGFTAAYDAMEDACSGEASS
jgi:invasion protein IalB